MKKSQSFENQLKKAIEDDLENTFHMNAAVEEYKKKTGLVFNTPKQKKVNPSIVI